MSTDHGQTWSAPVKTYGKVSWNDKPVLAVSDDGRDVYTSWNGPTGGDPWVAQSHDFGATWTQTKLVNSNRYYFAFDADVAPDGTVYLGESSLLYGGGGNKGTVPTGTIDHHTFVSTDRGATWTSQLVAQVQPGLAWQGHRDLGRRLQLGRPRRCGDARIVSHRRVAFFRVVARAQGQTANPQIAPEPDWHIPLGPAAR